MPERCNKAKYSDDYFYITLFITKLVEIITKKYLFSLNQNYRQHLKEGFINNELRKAFERGLTDYRNSPKKRGFVRNEPTLSFPSCSFICYLVFLSRPKKQKDSMARNAQHSKRDDRWIVTVGEEEKYSIKNTGKELKIYCKGDADKMRARAKITISLMMISLITIPILIWFFTGFFIYENPTIAIMAIWVIFAPLLIDYFEYSFDAFKIKYRTLINGSDLKRFDGIIGKILNDDTKRYTAGIGLLIHFAVMFMLPNAIPEIAYLTPLYLLFFVLLFPVSLMIGIMLFLARQVFKYIGDICEIPITINPYESDRFGGLSCIGNFTIAVTALLSTFSVVIPHAYTRVSTLEGLERFIPMTTLFLIIGGVLLLFGTTLYHVNRLASGEKRKIMVAEADKLKTSIKKLDEDGGSLKASVNAIARLKNYENLSKMKEWPFDSTTFVALLGSIILPIVFTVLPYLIGSPG